MKYLITDCTNDGILWAGTNAVICNQLRQGLLDTDIGVMHHSNPEYATISDTITVNNVYFNVKNSSINILPEKSLNAFYIERKRLALLREPAFVKLHNASWWHLRKTHISIIPTISTDIELALRLSTEDAIDPGIVEYASIHDISTEHAMKELRSISEGLRLERMRFFSYTELFVKRINSSSTEAEINLTMAEMNKKFVLDCYL